MSTVFAVYICRRRTWQTSDISLQPQTKSGFLKSRFLLLYFAPPPPLFLGGGGGGGRRLVGHYKWNKVANQLFFRENKYFA